MDGNLYIEEEESAANDGGEVKENQESIWPAFDLPPVDDGGDDDDLFIEKDEQEDECFQCTQDPYGYLVDDDRW